MGQTILMETIPEFAHTSCDNVHSWHDKVFCVNCPTKDRRQKLNNRGIYTSPDKYNTIY